LTTKFLLLRQWLIPMNKFISWTIEWRFNSTDVVLIDHGVHENTSLISVLETHLKPGPWNHPLKQFCEESLDSLKLFIRKHSKGSKSPFCELNSKAPLREQLANKAILEYPVIQVFLPSHNYDFEVIKSSVPRKVEREVLNCSDSPSPKGAMFREEDIGDDGSSDPHISDLLSFDRLNTTFQTSNKSSDVLSVVEEDTASVLGDTLVSFDSQVMSTKEMDPIGEKYWSLLGDILPMEDELEEGEIAPF
ncbi:hypothetical protein EJD97_023752, partial [Solanum chilense]